MNVLGGGLHFWGKMFHADPGYQLFYHYDILHFRSCYQSKRCCNIKLIKAKDLLAQAT